MTLHFQLMPLLALIAGILILIMPKAAEFHCRNLSDHLWNCRIVQSEYLIGAGYSDTPGAGLVA